MVRRRKKGIFYGCNLGQIGIFYTKMAHTITKGVVL